MRGYSFSELVKMSEGALKRDGDTATGNLTAPKFLLSAPQAAEPNSVVRKDFFDSTVADLNAGNSTMKLNIWEALRRSYAEAGYNLIAGSFESGATIVKAKDVLLYELDGRAYRYTGTRPHVVSSGTNPTMFYEYVDMSATLLRDDFGSKSFAVDFDRSGCKIAVIPRDLSLTTGQIDVFRKTAANWWMLEQFVTGRPSRGASIDDNCQAWRLGPQLRCHNVMTVMQATTYKDPLIGSYSMIPSHFFNGGANRPTVNLLQFTGHNQSAEYTISVDMETKDIGILFAGGPNATDFIVSFLQGGNEIYSEKVKTKMSGGSPLLTFSRSIPNPAYGMPTDLVIRVTSNSSAIENKYGYCGGVCCELDGINKQADTLIYTPAKEAEEFEIRPTQSGAMCYVFQEANTQLFGGESHGGETVTASAFRVNGTVATLSVDKLVVANTFDINQTGYISWSNGARVDFNTIHGVYSKNDTTFSGRFYPSAGFTASLVYCPMLTLSSKNWRRMTYPVGIDANTLPDPQEFYYDGHLNGITMQSKTNRMRAGIRFSSTLLQSDTLRFALKPYAGFDSKVYMGQNTQGKYGPVTAFTTEQVRFVV